MLAMTRKILQWLRDNEAALETMDYDDDDVNDDVEQSRRQPISVELIYSRYDYGQAWASLETSRQAVGDVLYSYLLDGDDATPDTPSTRMARLQRRLRQASS